MNIKPILENEKSSFEEACKQGFEFDLLAGYRANVEEMLSRVGGIGPESVDRLMAARGAEMRRATEAIAEMIGPLTGAQSVESIMRDFRESLAPRDAITAKYREMLANVSGGADRPAALRSELLGNITGVECARDAMKAMIDSYGVRNSLDSFQRTYAEDIRRDFLLRRSVSDYHPAHVELPNLAKEKIDYIEQDEREKRENLPIGKSLEMYVIAGGMEFRVLGATSFSAADQLTVEVTTIDGDATLSMPHDQIVTLYRQVDIFAKDEPDTIH